MWTRPAEMRCVRAAGRCWRTTSSCPRCSLWRPEAAGPRRWDSSCPQRVTFDIDANGILNVTAADKSTGKESKITITNDKGRLTKEDIDRMVNDAEKYKEEDESNRERVSAKNGLESYTYQIKQTAEDEKLKGKLSDQDKEKILSKCKEVVDWLERNQMAEKEEFEHKQKELEKLWNPIMSKVYQGGAGNPGAAGGGAGGPTIEEVD